MKSIDKCIEDGKSFCQNGGVCHVSPMGDIECTCSNQYSGTNCEIGNYFYNSLN